MFVLHIYQVTPTLTATCFVLGWGIGLQYMIRSNQHWCIYDMRVQTAVIIWRITFTADNHRWVTLSRLQKQLLVNQRDIHVATLLDCFVLFIKISNTRVGFDEFDFATCNYWTPCQLYVHPLPTKCLYNVYFQPKEFLSLTFHDVKEQWICNTRL